MGNSIIKTLFSLIIFPFLCGGQIIINDNNIADAISLWYSNPILAESVYGNISEWDVSSVTNMSYLFYTNSSEDSSFNEDIGDWDVSSVTDMSFMFREASEFNQDIGNWDVSSMTDMSWMFHYAGLSTENYDALLIAWSQLDLQNFVPFHGGYSTYCLGAEARQYIIDTFSWDITDGGQECVSVVEGCTDENACNYDETATVDDESCEYPVANTDCNGNCLEGFILMQGAGGGGGNGNGNGSGMCVEIVEGCTDENAYNYDETANTDDGSCTILICEDLASYGGPMVVEFVKEDDSDWTLSENRDFITPTCEITRQNSAPLYNYVTQSNSYDNLENSNIRWKAGAYDDDTWPYENDLENLSGIGNLTSLPGSTVTLHVLDDDLYFELYFTSWTCCGDGGGFAYTRTFVDIENQGMIQDCNEFPLVYGCTNPAYFEYDELSTFDDDSCLTEIVEGCTDENACNYDEAANMDDASCYYAQLDFACDENILIGLWEIEDDDSDIFYIEFLDDGSIIVYGSEEGSACLLIDPDSLYTQYIYSENTLTFYEGSDGQDEYSMTALANGSIEVREPGESAISVILNPIESLPIEMCIVEGCTDTEACNYNVLTTDANPDLCIYVENECAYCSGAIDGTGFIIDNDIDDDGICDDCSEYYPQEGINECIFFDPDTDMFVVCENLDFYQEVYVYDFNEEECILTTSCFCECINDSDGDGVCDENESIILIEDTKSSKELIKKVDVLGRETSKKGLKIKIYNDGSIEKKYIIE